MGLGSSRQKPVGVIQLLRATGSERKRSANESASSVTICAADAQRNNEMCVKSVRVKIHSFVRSVIFVIYAIGIFLDEIFTAVSRGNIVTTFKGTVARVIALCTNLPANLSFSVYNYIHEDLQIPFPAEDLAAQQSLAVVARRICLGLNGARGA